MTRAPNDERAAAILGLRASGMLAHDEALAELADADCAAALAAAIAERVRVRADFVLRALEAESDEAISVMCRAAGFKINSYSALLRMRRRNNRGGDAAPTRALMVFSDLTRASAEKLLARMVADLGARGSGKR